MALRIVIKPQSDVDSYVLWSKMWDCPLGVGSKEHTIELFRRESGEDGVQHAMAMVEQADREGSSDDGELGKWTCPPMTLRQGAGSPWTLKREHLVDYCSALAFDDEERAAKLVDTVPVT